MKKDLESAKQTETFKICGESFTEYPGADEIVGLLNAAEEVTGDDFYNITLLFFKVGVELNQDIFDISLEKLTGSINSNQLNFLFLFQQSGCKISVEKINRETLDKLLSKGIEFQKFKINSVILNQLSLAVERGSITQAMLEILLEKGIDFTEQTMNPAILTQLSLAVERGSITQAMLEILFNGGIDFSEYKMTPATLSQLSLAVKKGSITRAMLEKLLEEGIDFSFIDEEGKKVEFKMDPVILSQLSLAVERGSITQDILEILLKKEIDFSKFKMAPDTLNQLSLAVMPNSLDGNILDKLFAESINTSGEFKLNSMNLLNLANAIVSGTMKREYLIDLLKGGCEGYLNAGSEQERILRSAFGDECFVDIIVPNIDYIARENSARGRGGQSSRRGGRGGFLRNGMRESTEQARPSVRGRFPNVQRRAAEFNASVSVPRGRGRRGRF